MKSLDNSEAKAADNEIKSGFTAYKSATMIAALLLITTIAYIISSERPVVKHQEIDLARILFAVLETGELDKNNWFTATNMEIRNDHERLNDYRLISEKELSDTNDSNTRIGYVGLCEFNGEIASIYFDQNLSIVIVIDSQRKIHTGDQALYNKCTLESKAELHYQIENE